ncbi:RNA polymerase subunit sigma-70 [Pararcticibacter amylolyticus]|uniref:RNA polymerase subunit sigma-70 n=2 Tax=Pararcticibacter amylolyticus TaxID=2173175 RepID=A0A2U2PLX6_9SPHI|nr:RNA polymerase subunit sigma-70 [Pararcticibacter amylolyticus]
MKQQRVVSDEELMYFFKQGSEIAFAEIYERYWGKLFLHARKLLKDDEEARDVIQEVFTQFWQRAASVDISVALSSYLYKIVRNRIFDHIKHKKVVNDYLSSLTQFMEEGVLLTDVDLREKELSALIEREIQALPPKMRHIFELSRKQHLSYKEIADSLGISEHTVKSQVSNALRILKSRTGVAGIVFLFLSGL